MADQEKTEKYRKKVEAALNNCLVHTDLPLPGKICGKVRDIYPAGDKMLLITTDRQSAFDRVLAAVPFKGQVLNLTSEWWFTRTGHIIPNHLEEIPDPNVTVGKTCTVFPVEFVVRGYMTGSTGTSLWTRYSAGEREYCGHKFPDGMVKNQPLETAVVTPTTKETEHDRPVSGEEILREGLMSKEDWEYASAKALELFRFGQKTAREHGLLLVDTKYEMGKDRDGVIRLVDEIHTPDSSRYWIAGTYEERFSRGDEPENIDKEFLRLWFKDRCDPYKDEVLPTAPPELITELSLRYIQLYEMITGNEFPFPEEDELKIPASRRLETNLRRFL